MTYPSTHKAVVVNDAEVSWSNRMLADKQNGVIVKTLPVPKLNDSEVLVRVAYASQAS